MSLLFAFQLILITIGDTYTMDLILECESDSLNGKVTSPTDTGALFFLDDTTDTIVPGFYGEKGIEGCRLACFFSSYLLYFLLQWIDNWTTKNAWLPLWRTRISWKSWIVVSRLVMIRIECWVFRNTITYLSKAWIEQCHGKRYVLCAALFTDNFAKFCNFSVFFCKRQDVRRVGVYVFGGDVKP